jgi:hypothetical protein
MRSNRSDAKCATGSSFGSGLVHAARIGGTVTLTRTRFGSARIRAARVGAPRVRSSFAAAGARDDW